MRGDGGSLGKTADPKVLGVHVPSGGEGSPPGGAMALVVGDRFRIELEKGFDEVALERLLAVLGL